VQESKSERALELPAFIREFDDHGAIGRRTSGKRKSERDEKLKSSSGRVGETKGGIT